MARWFGKVGYSIDEETSPGVHNPRIVERESYGDIIKATSSWNGSSEVNDNLVLNKTISIVAEPFAFEHYSRIVYIEYMGTKWKVTSVDPQRPRLVLTTGGVYVE